MQYSHLRALLLIAFAYAAAVVPQSAVPWPLDPRCGPNLLLLCLCAALFLRPVSAAIVWGTLIGTLAVCRDGAPPGSAFFIVPLLALLVNRSHRWAERAATLHASLVILVVVATMTLAVQSNQASDPRAAMWTALARGASSMLVSLGAAALWGGCKVLWLSLRLTLFGERSLRTS